MKFFRLPFLPLLAAALTVSLPAQPRTQPVVKLVETARVAYINSSAFVDPTTGIKQLVKVTQALELEFSGTQSELSLLGEKLRTLAAELNKLSTDPVANAKAITDKQTEGQRLQQDLAARQQAAQEAYNKRAQVTQVPVANEIGKELRAFAKERDIGLLFDSAKLGDGLLDAKPELDLTADFIGYFNAKHP
jgi:Skp family chaperone for outer membrane proteins